MSYAIMYNYKASENVIKLSIVLPEDQSLRSSN